MKDYHSRVNASSRTSIALASGPESSTTFSILVVCAANQCRSPALQSVLSEGAGGFPGLGGSVSISSAGVSHDEGVPVDPSTKRALLRAGYSAPDHLSRRVTPELIGSADLILTASRRHRTQVVRMDPDALSRTYTAREFARYCSTILSRPPTATLRSPAGRLEAALLLAQQERGMSFPARATDDDIPDPVGRSKRVHSRVVRLIVETSTSILAVASADIRPVNSKGPGLTRNRT